MEKDAFLNRLNAEFDTLVEEYIPSTEVGFKKYAIENLNPVSHLAPVADFSIPRIMKALNEGIIVSKIQFEGSSDSGEYQLQYKNWSEQLVKLFFRQITNAILDNPEFSVSAKKQISENTAGLISEVAFQLPAENRDTINAVSEYLNEKSKKALDILPKNLYYWEYEPTKLMDLYNLLIENDLIEPNDNFVKSFCSFEVKSLYKTVWKKEPDNQTSLFALLYLILGKQKIFRNEPVGLIAHKLFKLNKIKFSKNNVNTAFNQFVERDTKEYLNKKHSQIVHLISRLNLNI